MEKRFGVALADWKAPVRPDGVVLEGAYIAAEPLTVAHAPDLFRAYQADAGVWDYLPYGPYARVEDYAAWVAKVQGGSDPVFFALRDQATGRFGGVASYLRITPEVGTIEVGHINLSPELQRGRASTEAMFLMMDWAFAAGYRRYEWKCDALNMPSRRAAQRLGFSYEGTFRQAAVVKGRNRDTAWFSVIDGEWPRLRKAFETWLSPANFRPDGGQKQSLSSLTRGPGFQPDPELG
jgi:RimJ/RimL family protein N-acetyltransferase